MIALRQSEFEDLKAKATEIRELVIKNTDSPEEIKSRIRKFTPFEGAFYATKINNSYYVYFIKWSPGAGVKHIHNVDNKYCGKWIGPDDVKVLLAKSEAYRVAYQQFITNKKNQLVQALAKV